MNVKALQQFLHSLVEPLRESGAGAQTVADLQRIQAGLEPFRDQPVAEFADFLTRAHDYERQGHWPRSEPAIKGHVVDEPAIADYAERLRAFLQHAVPERGPMSAAVPAELKRLAGRLKLAQLKELALALKVAEPGKSSAVVLECIFLQLTGRPLKPALLECHADRLQALAGKPELDSLLQDLSKSLTVTELKKLAATLKVPGKVATKSEAVHKIRVLLNGPDREGQSPPVAGVVSSASALEARLTEIVATLNALKSRAEADDTAEEEIDGQLQLLAATMNREEAVSAARNFGVAWHVETKSEALDRIRRRIFERKRAAESIQF